MSLILDALHRSDQERNDQRAVPGIQTLHGQSVVADSRRRTTGIVVVALVVAAILVFAVFNGRQSGESRESDIAIENLPEPNLLERRDEDTALGSSVAGLESATIPAASPATEPVAGREPVEESRPEIGPEIGNASEGVASLYQNAAAANTAPVAQSAESMATAAVDVGSSQSSPSVDATSEDRLRVDALVAAARKEIATPPDDDSSVPLMQELPQKTKDEIPSIFFSTHDWSPAADARSVTLNGTLHRQGDSVVAGVKLIEILPESIILDYRGTRFRLRALNSWVNL